MCSSEGSLFTGQMLAACFGGSNATTHRVNMGLEWGEGLRGFGLLSQPCSVADAKTGRSVSGMYTAVGEESAHY
jgi:hypothetical protein